MKKINRFYYQPSFFNNLISWSWTYILLILALIFGFEYTQFNWISAILGLFFILIVFIQFFNRTIEIIDDDFILNRAVVNNEVAISIKEVKIIKITRCGLHLKLGPKVERILVTKKAKNKLITLLKYED